MHRLSFVAAALLCSGAIAAMAEEPTGRPRAGQPTVPPAAGVLGSDLNRSGGVITPPAGVDPEIRQTPPPTGAKMPVIPPPGTPGGDPAVKPK